MSLKGQRGMTLVELLVALLVMALLMSLIYSAFRTGNSVVDRVLVRADESEQYQAVVRLLRRQIEHTALLATRDNKMRRIVRFRGLSQSVSLVAPLPLYSDGDALYAIRFYYQDDGLQMAFHPVGGNKDEVEVLELLPNLQQFNIEYLNAQAQWTSHWLHQNRLPAALRITIQSQSDGVEASHFLPVTLHRAGRL